MTANHQLMLDESQNLAFDQEYFGKDEFQVLIGAMLDKFPAGQMRILGRP